MKRLVWLVLAVFGTVLAQVPPVDVSLKKHVVCSCCQQAGDCGRPDCLPPAAPAQPVFNLPATVAVARARLRCVAPAPRGLQEKFYVQFESRPAARPEFGAPLVLAPAASVSLFKTHCSFLL